MITLATEGSGQSIHLVSLFRLRDECGRMANTFKKAICSRSWIRTGHLSEEEKQQLLIYLTCMRMVCDSTYILNTNTNHGNKIGEISGIIEELTENPGQEPGIKDCTTQGALPC